MVSFAAAIFVLFILGTRIYTDGRGFRKTLTRHASRITPAILVFILIAILLPSPATSDNQTWDFAQMGYLHPTAEVQFDNGVTLEQYAYSAEATTAGTDWMLTLWLDGVSEATDGAIELTTPAINRFAAAPPLAVLSQPQPQPQPLKFIFYSYKLLNIKFVT